MNTPDLEGMVQQHLASVPWWGRLLYGGEMRVVESSLERIRELKAQPRLNDPEWYGQYRRAVDEGFGAARHAMDKTYDMYETLSSLPIIGGFVKRLARSYLGRSFGLNDVPSREATGSMMDAAENLYLTTLRVFEETNTGTYAQAPRFRVHSYDTPVWDALQEGAGHARGLADSAQRAWRAYRTEAAYAAPFSS